MSKSKSKFTKDDLKNDPKFDRTAKKGDYRGRKRMSRKAGNLEESSKNVATSDFICSAGRPTNDPKWYLNNPVLSRDVGSIWFSRPTGDALVHTGIIIREGENPDPTPQTLYDVFDPGILAIPTITTWGSSPAMPIDGASAEGVINLTAQKLYQYVVHANSRNISYDKKDLIMTLMAIDGVYQVITEAIRAYRLIAHYDPENKYASSLLYASRWNAADLRANVAEFRYYINWAITRVNKLFMPNLFDVVKSHVAAYENVYTDRPSNKAQFIIKYSAGLWLYNDEHGALEYANSVQGFGNNFYWTSAVQYDCRTVTTFRNVIDVMLTRIEKAQYLGVMQGDLLKAFGMERMTKYDYIGIDMPFAPIYDEEFLLKLHNADISNMLATEMFTHLNSTREHCAIIMRDTQEVDGNITCYRTVPFGNGVDSDVLNGKLWNKVRLKNGTMVDLPSHIPSSPDNVMLMCLNKLGIEYSTQARWYVTDEDFVPSMWYGTMPPEIYLRARLFLDPGNMNTLLDVSSYVGSDNAFAKTVGFMSRFKMFPLFTSVKSQDEDSLPIAWETDNVAHISERMYERIMSVVFWSLWASSEISSSEAR